MTKEGPDAAPGVPAWAMASAAALAVSSVHYVLDWHIGLFGSRSDAVSPLQALLVWGVAGISALWVVGAVAAARDRGWGFAVLVAISVGWVIAGNGAPIFACLPPCAGAFPHQDVAHIGSLVLGAFAAITAWTAGRQAGMRLKSVGIAIAAMMIVLAAVFWSQATLTL